MSENFNDKKILNILVKMRVISLNKQQLKEKKIIKIFLFKNSLNISQY